MVTYRTVDGSTASISKEEVEAVLPYGGVFLSPFVKSPYDGLVCVKGEILPVLGPAPAAWQLSDNYDERPWLLLCKDHVRVIYGLPEVKNELVQAESFSESLRVTTEESVDAELDELLKDAS